MTDLDAVAPGKDETLLISGATGGVGALALQIAAARPGAEAGFVTCG
ncbi:hypothetical protein ACFV3E_23025 [Streptomyces sp. NPDC059718]